MLATASWILAKSYYFLLLYSVFCGQKLWEVILY